MGRKRHSGGGVEWRLPHQRRPFAHTTSATSFGIEILADEGLTVDAAIGKLIYDAEGRAVLQRLSDEGYGHVELTLLVGGDTPQDEVAKMRRPVGAQAG